MDKALTQRILDITNGKSLIDTQLIQTLWSGYGELLKCRIEGSQHSSAIVKHIKLPDNSNHPRGWNTNRSRERKLRSYEVEMNWYSTLARQSNDNCRIPQVLESWRQAGEMLIVMEDLDASGYPLRKTTLDIAGIKTCLSWLAHFHAAYMQQKPKGLWEIGSYWHLDTRPDEWNQMQDLDLKAAASAIDAKLNGATYQTIIHGDAKLANFCFSETGERVAAVDFQYVGGGCGMKDVAYFLSSCLSEAACERHEDELLNHYFYVLKNKLSKEYKNIDYQSVINEWKELYKYTWADFYRFLDGWSPGHWKMHDYSKRMKQEVLEQLNAN